ncbi:uncharacterized protein [Miscanthus floridulus]|uniref:uncharacterized protein n=1 Tax=Miscanthus floridulus TaxID=154761 RepID=UPI00345795B1
MGMAANGELVQEGGGREEGEEDMDMDDEATFLSLEFALTGHQSSAFDRHEDEKKENTEDGKRIHSRQLVVAVEASHRGDDAVSEALWNAGPAVMLRTLVRKLRRWKAAGPGYPSASRGHVAALEDGNRGFMAKGEVQPEAARRPGAGVVTSNSAERWTPTTAEAVLKYLSKMPILACRRGMSDGPDDTSPPPPAHNLPDATAPGRRSRGETGLRQACKRLGISRSSVAASPPPTPQRRDDSLLQAQDGIASAIAYCKLSLTTSRGFESPKVSFRG